MCRGSSSIHLLVFQLMYLGWTSREVAEKLGDVHFGFLFEVLLSEEGTPSATYSQVYEIVFEGK